MNIIKHIFLDVDGTLTDGKIYYNSEGVEIKAFNVKDGLIISSMVKVGYRFIVVTGRRSQLVEKRMKELGIEEIFQGVLSKKKFIFKYMEAHQMLPSLCGYLGDDLNDLVIMKEMGFRGCPADACAEIKSIADFVSEKKGGEGAARDILERLIYQNDDWEAIKKIYD